jgi:hypothetical protein
VVDEPVVPAKHDLLTLHAALLWLVGDGAVVCPVAVVPEPTEAAAAGAAFTDGAAGALDVLGRAPAMVVAAALLEAPAAVELPVAGLCVLALFVEPCALWLLPCG